MDDLPAAGYLPPVLDHRVGRYASLAPAIWLYAGDTLLIAGISIRMVKLTPDLEHGDHLRRRVTSSVLLALFSLLAITLSFVNPKIALWGFVLNFVQPVIERWRYSQPRTD